MTGRREVRPFSTGALRYHVPLVLGVAGCLAAGWFELTRARAGHTVAWVYVFEWPAFAVAGVVIWWRIITNRDERRPGPDASAPQDGPAAEVDPGLAAWRSYLDGLRDADGPDAR